MGWDEMAKTAQQKLASAHGMMHVLAVGVSEYGNNSGFTRLKVCTVSFRQACVT